MHFLRDIDYQGLVLLLQVPGKNFHSHPSHLPYMYTDNKCSVSNPFFRHIHLLISPQDGVSVCLFSFKSIWKNWLLFHYWLN